MKIDWRVKNILQTILIFIFIYILVVLSSTCQQARAQNVKKQGNTFIEVDTAKTICQGKVYETDYVYVDKKGNAYPIYLSSNGNAFIIKVSQKSGNKYRKYLPEITKKLQNKAK